LQSAYEVLSDEEAREAYDRYGQESLSGHGGMHNEADLNDLFSDLFGAGPGMAGSGPRPTKAPDTVVDYDVTLEDLFK
jgi:DnaJ-class molecular chaperone